MEDKKKASKRLAKYSGLAFQLLAFIGVGYFIGSWIDRIWKTKTPYGTALGATAINKPPLVCGSGNKVKASITFTPFSKTTFSL